MLASLGSPPMAGTCTFGQWGRCTGLTTLAIVVNPDRSMSLLIVLAALGFLMLVAYRGHSVILFAPVAAMGAVLLTDPDLVAPMFTGLFMDRMVGFLKLYFPVFLLGAVFGKLIELSGFSKSIVAATIRLFGPQRAMLSIVTVCALLTYGGVSLFVVVFAVYPFAAELFRQAAIPKRLIPGTIALGAFTFTMMALPGTPQIQNIIPTAFFGTDSWAAPALGTIGSILIFAGGMAYLEWRRRKAAVAGEGYGENLLNEPEPFVGERLAHPLVALLPLLNNPSSVILCGSVSARIGLPTSSAYAASKAALLSLARTLSAELLPRGIRVNGLSPGPVKTPAFTKTGLSDEALNAMMAEVIKLVPLGRMGSTTELAKAALYLASDESSYTVGTELLVDGGMGSL